MKGSWVKRGSGDIVVLFIHGILSDGDNAWQSPTGTYWPKLLAEEPAFQSTGIYVFSYHTSKTSKDYSISDAADSLHELIMSENILDFSKLVFCCHSMGGLVARRYLVKHQLELSARGKQIGLFLVGSPSLGSSLANIANALTRKVISHAQLEDLRYVDANRWLYELNSDFKRLLNSPNFQIMGKELVEDSSDVIGRTIGPIVTPQSGAAFFKDALKIPRSSHSSICKPVSRDDLQHLALCNFVKSMQEWRKAPVQSRQPRSIELTPVKMPQHFKFDYKYRLTDFVGRTQELNELKQFIATEEKFSWWVLKGPGGSGKSRLASELILEISKSSDSLCLFVQQSDLNQYANGTRELSHDTVLIVDYAARFFPQVLQIISDYATRGSQKHKLRILLIERETDGRWWERLCHSFEAARTSHSENPLELTGMDEEQIVKIIRDVVLKENKELTLDDLSLLSIIKRLDPQLRPLFGMFLGVALADRVFEFNWNQYDLLKHQLQREKLLIDEKYSTLGPDLILRHRRLLTLATICNGIEEEMLLRVLGRGIYWLPSLEEFDINLYSDLSGFHGSVPGLGAAPMLPDILGEFFVLEELSLVPTTPYKNPDWVDQIMSLANEASFIKYFLRRVLQDFPTHKNILLLLKAKYLFGMFGMDILALMKYIFSGSIETLKALWKCAKHLHDSQDLTEKIFMDHPTRVYQEATSIMVWKNIGDLAEQLYYYEIIKANLDAVTTTELSEENGLVEIFVPDMAYQECQAIHSMLETYKVLSRLNEVNELINRLEGLNNMFTDPRIRYVAFLSYKLVYIDTPKILDEKIRELVSLLYATPPQIPSIDVNLEKSHIMNEIFFYYLKGRGDEETAKKYYQQFSADVVKQSFHRPSVEAIEQYGHTAANAIEYHLANGDRTACIWYFDNIKAINKYLGPNSSGILQIMISELGDKLFKIGKD